MTQADPSASAESPVWRACCTRCGKSKPLASVGGVRIAARSVHKYTLGYCHDCRRHRFLRILHATGPADASGPASAHRLILVVVTILAAVLLINLLVAWMVYLVTR
jgi:hypothetical protein